MNGHASINRLYRLVWSDAQGGWIAVAETARGRGKASGRSKLAAALFAGLGLTAMSSAWAGGAPPAVNQLPTGGKVAAGAVTINQSGNHLDVTQTSQRGAVDWATFNVGAQAQVNFAQPSANAVTLNRVQDTQASQIFGRITSNGQVFLSNPNGVYFSPTASVDVGGLVATTGTMSVSDFMAGGNTFTRDGATGSVVNDGTLTASLGGYIALLAPEVRNNGIVIAQAGTVALAAGDSVELQFDNSRSLTGVLVSPSAIAALVENGSAVRAPGGLIIMSAHAADQLQGGVVRNSGTLEATALATRGGKIVLDSSGLVDNSGSLDASGKQGGSIAITADRMLSAGTLRADGTSQGGTITSQLANGLVETTSALVSATGGGTISVDGGAGEVYSSGTYDADGLAAGQKGGGVTITAHQVALMGASVSASGHDGGGSVRVGGDLHGTNAAVVNAQTTTIGTGVTLKADATSKGDGGKVVVWSDDTTTFSGAVSAKGGAQGGNGGQLEVSGKGTLHFAGTGDASAAHGTAGSLLLDPKDIFIDDQVSAQLEYIDPHSTSGGTFGATVTALTTTTNPTVADTSGTIKGTTAYTGKIVITNPTDTLGGANSGAVYLFDRSNQALISTLYGGNAGDQTGSGGIVSLTNGNFVVASPLWNGGRGAATWGSGTTGWGSGATVAISSANSLVGSLATHNDTANNPTSDAVGNTVKALITGNYLVADSSWNNDRGAVAFGNGTTGTSGVVGASNALVGSTPISQAPGGQIRYLGGDGIGSVTYLANGNYVIADENWNKGVGAVALGSGTTGISGVVSASTALLGNSSRSDAAGNGSGTDKVGQFLTVLDGTQFVTWSSSWNNGAGEVSWSNGSTLPVGLVSSANSLVGNANDFLGGSGVKVLPSNNAYVISSISWNGGDGAATWVPFGTNVKTINVATSGVTGSTAGDNVGSKDVTVLSNGDYVLSSPNWGGGKGAVTLVDGTTGKTKLGQGSTVGSGNSIVGSQTTDNVGQQGILELVGSGDFLALSPNWSNGGTAKVGAVTWSSGGTPTVGAVSSSNSLVGNFANDRIGEVQYTSWSSGVSSDNQYASVTALSNGNYVVASPMWNGTRGAVTLGDGSAGTVGAVTISNSFTGSSAGDYVGSFSTTTAAASPSPAYFTLSNGVQALADGNFVVVSDFWKNGSAVKAGAVTWSSGSTGATVGAVSSANSVVGSTTDDRVGASGDSNGITRLLAGYDSNGNQLYSSNYVILTSRWDNGAVTDAGAITWGSGTAGSHGAISNANSVIGTKTNEMSSATLQPLATGNYLILDTVRDIGSVTRAGALTLVDGSTGHVSDYAANGNTNVISAANSLVGSTTDDMLSAYLVPLFTASASTNGVAEGTGNYVLSSYGWDDASLGSGGVDVGAVTWGSGTTGVTGVITRANSLIGDKAPDYITTYPLGYYITYLPTGDYVVGNPYHDVGPVVNAGAATWVSGATGHVSDYAAQGNQNIVSAANSMIGSHPNDFVGDGVYSFYDAIGDYNRTGYFIFSTSWDCLAGALTYVVDGSTPLIGVVDATNSAVGDPNGHFVGGLGYSPYPALVPNSTAIATFAGDGGHVYEVSPVMPATGGMAIASATQFGDAAGSSQMITPDYVASVLMTGTSLVLQASNDILVRGAIDATGGTAGGSLTLDAGRSIAILGDIVTGNRDLTLVANDTLANGVHDAQRDAGVATISMGANTLGHVAVIDAGTGNVSMTMSAGADKTNHMGGSISLDTVTAASIAIINHGDGAGTSGDLPTLADCCGYTFGTQSVGANIVLNQGAILHATGSGTAVALAADGQFVNSSGNAASSIDISDPSGRWLVYASAPGTSSFAGLDSGNTAIWNQTYDPNTPVAAGGNRYVFAFQPTVTFNTQNISKAYGTDLTGGGVLNGLATAATTGLQAGVSGAFLGDTLSTATTGATNLSSSGSGSHASVAGGPYNINVNLSNIVGNNGYAVAAGSTHTITVTPKTLTASLTGVTKTYDATATATLATTNYALAGLVNGDTFNVTKTSGSFNSANVATATSASTTLASGDFTGLSGSLASNYVLPTSAAGSATITPKTLTAALTGTITKAYDTNANATVASGNYLLTGFVGGQSATVGQTAATYNSANVAQATTATATLASGDFTAGGSTTLSNYTLPTSASGAASITPLSLGLTLTGSVGKTYDGTATDPLAPSNFNLTGFIGGQSATVTLASGTFNSPTVAGATTVTATLASSDYAAGSGTVLTNYVLPTSASTSASISRAALAVTANNATKTYDGTAYSGGNGVTYTGLVNGQTASVLGGALAYGGTSQGATNVGTYMIVPSGLTAANYNISFVDGALSINPLVLIAVTANLTGNLGKTYDGTNAATLTGANFNLVGFVNGDSANVTRTNGTYDGINAGSHTVTVNLASGDFSAVGSTQLSNYTLPTSASGVGTIAPRAVTLTAPTLSKVYDGGLAALTTAGNLATLSAALVGGDTVSAATLAYTDKNAGAGNRSVTLSGVSLNDGNNGGNYTVTLAGNANSTITPRTLNVGATGTGRTYDASTDASVTLSDDRVVGDTLSVTDTNAQFTNKNAGTNKTINVTGIGVAGTDAGNYVLASASTTATAIITPASLVVGGVTAVDRAYDTQTGVALGGTPTVAPLGNDVVTVTGTPVASMADKNVGTGKAVTVSGYTTSDSNYVLVQPTGLSVDITPAILQLAGLATAPSRTYDGSRSVALTGTPTVTGLGGEVVTVSGTATGQLADKNVGSNKAVTVSGLASSDSNYVIGQEPGLATTVTPASLVVGGVTAIDRAYDTQTGVALGGTATITPLAGDVVTLGGTPTATMADKNAGTAKAVTVGGYTINDANYVLVQPAGLTVDITPAILQLGGLLTTSPSKTYDGTRTVTLGGTPTVTGFGGEVVTVSGTAVGQTADKNVGANKAITVSGLVSSDGNYAIGQEPGLATSVTPASLVVTGVTAVDRAYDTQTGVALGGTPTIAPLAGDIVTLAGTPVATMADKNAGTDKPVTVGGYTINDANYVLVQPTGLTVDIAPAILQLGGLATAPSRTYDGSRSVALAGTPTVTGLGGEVVTVSGTATGQLADKNVGSNKAVTVSGLVSSDSNYAIGQEPGLATTVTPASLVVTGLAAVDRAYDTQTGVALSGTATIAPLAGDVVTLVGTPAAAMADKNVGTAKAVTVSGYTINDANYVLVEPAGLTVDITPALLQLGGLLTTTPNKTYDGTRNVALSGTPTVTGLGGEVVTLSGTAVGQLADKNVGANKAITISGLVPSDSNYAIGQEPGLTTTVTPASLVVTGLSAVNRVYDTQAGVALSGTAAIAPLAGDVVVLQGTPTATMADKNAGIAKPVTVTGYSIADANYMLVEPAGLTVDISPAILQLGGLLTASASKTYDGTRNVALTGTPTVTGLGGEVVTLSGTAIGQTADKNVGANKTITVSGLVPSDGNYAVGQQPGLATSVTPASLAVTGVTANNKPFDGTTSATLGGTATVAPVAGDDIALSGVPSASFADAGAGTAKPVTVTGYTIVGADNTNYTLVQPVGLHADITALSTVPVPVVVPPPPLPTPPSTPPLSTPPATVSSSPAVTTTETVPVGPVATVAATTTTADHILVSLVREPSQQQSGVITVSVPKDVANAANGFAFPMPTPIIEAAAANHATVVATAQDGTPLPSWVHYDAQAGTFVVTEVPSGGLPLQVLVVVGDQRVVVSISEH